MNALDGTLKIRDGELARHGVVPRVLFDRALVFIFVTNFCAISFLVVLMWVFRESIAIFSSEQLKRVWVLAMVYSNCIQIALSYFLPRTLPTLVRRPSRTRILAFSVQCLAAIAIAFGLAAVLVRVLEVVASVPIDESPATKIITSLWSVLLSATVWSFTFYHRSVQSALHLMSLRLSAKELEEASARRFAAEAQLSSLQSRTNPHFLFNSLNSIAALIPEDPARAEQMIELLAALLRFSLDGSQRRVVPLQQELKVVLDYLQIEKARFGARLTYHIDSADSLGDVEVPPMSLQTLVENSVKYAVAPRPEGGHIRVVLHAKTQHREEKSGERVSLQVCDDGPGFTPEALMAGHGLENLQARLQALYGNDATLEFAKRDNEMAVVIVLPRRAPSQHSGH
ncbi:MAG TPA: histidine kinase [Abditibacteriaceae bacterium]|jgi:sensor histidine kinase YesM